MVIVSSDLLSIPWVANVYSSLISSTTREKRAVSVQHGGYSFSSESRHTAVAAQNTWWKLGVKGWRTWIADKFCCCQGDNKNKKAAWANGGRMTEIKWESKNKIKLNRKRSALPSRLLMTTSPTNPEHCSCASCRHAGSTAWGKCDGGMVWRINVPIVIFLSLLHYQFPLSTRALSNLSPWCIWQHWLHPRHQLGSQFAVVMPLLRLWLLCSLKATAMGTQSITQH